MLAELPAAVAASIADILRQELVGRFITCGVEPQLFFSAPCEREDLEVRDPRWVEQIDQSLAAATADAAQIHGGMSGLKPPSVSIPSWTR